MTIDYYDDEKEIGFIDVIKYEDFWGGFIMGIIGGSLALMVIWTIFTLLSGNDPDWNLIGNETGNFIIFLAVIISGYKNYTSCYNKLSKEKIRTVEERKEREKESEQED